MASLPRSLPLPYVSPERVHEILEELVIELKTLQQELGREPATEIN